MEKPTFGPMVRAAMLVITVLFTLYRALALTVGDAAVRDYPWAHKQTGVSVAVWVVAAIYTLVAGWIAYRVVRERFPPAGVYVFPALAINPFAETVMSVVGGLMLLMLPLILVEAPLMHAQFDHNVAALLATRGLANPWTLGSAESSNRQLDVIAQGGPLIIFVPFAFMLLLWRPIFLVKPGQAIVRHRIGGWLPWKQRFESAPTLAWDVYYGGGRVNRVPVGYMLRGTLGKKTFDLEYVGLGCPEQEREHRRVAWRERLVGAGARR